MIHDCFIYPGTPNQFLIYYAQTNQTKCGNWYRSKDTLFLYEELSFELKEINVNSNSYAEINKNGQQCKIDTMLLKNRGKCLIELSTFLSSKDNEFELMINATD